MPSKSSKRKSGTSTKAGLANNSSKRRKCSQNVGIRTRSSTSYVKTTLVIKTQGRHHGKHKTTRRNRKHGLKDDICFDMTIAREAIKQNYTEIVRLLDKDIKDILLQENVISWEQFEELCQTEKHGGNSKLCKQLLGFVLDDPEDGHLKRFLEILQQEQSCIFILLENYLKSDVVDRVFQGVLGELKRAYKSKKFTVIETLPGEPFKLDLDKHSEYVMPLVFESQVRKQQKLSPLLSERRKQYTYEDKSFATIEEIIGNLLKPVSKVTDEVPRVILARGNAGCGKTFFIHGLVHKFLNESDPYIRQFDLVIAIPVRNVDPDGSLMEMLDDGPKGMGYFCRKSIGIVEKCFQEMNVLVILDGVDEVKVESTSHIFNFILGKTYPNVKILILARPEATLLSELFDSDAHFFSYIVDIEGTSEVGVKQYLECIITELGGHSEEEVKNIISKCQERMIEFDILKVPLYLTLTGIIFNEHHAVHASFTDFQVPETVTELFSSFFCIVVGRWISKKFPASDAQKIKFTRSPFEKGTNIPLEILRIIQQLAELSFHCLKNKTYDFSEADLESVLVSVEDINISGFFCSGDGKYFYRHKMLQEYMAALHIARPLGIVNEILNLHTAKLQSFEKVFKNFEIVVPFVFGLSPEKALAIISAIQGNVAFEFSLYNLKTAFHANYTGKLMYEGRNHEVTQNMIKMVQDSPARVITGDCPTPIIPLQNHFYKSLSLKQAAVFLLSWYNVEVKESGEYFVMKQGMNTSAIIDTVRFYDRDIHLNITVADITLMSLLNKFSFPNIMSLVLDNTLEKFPNLSFIAIVFPGLKKLSVKKVSSSEIYTWHEVQIQHHNPSIKNIVGPHLCYSPESQSSLLQQRELEFLSLRSETLFYNLSENKPKIKLNELKVLLIGMEKLVINKSEVGCSISDLTYLFQHLPQLNILSLYSLNYCSEELSRQLLEIIQAKFKVKKSKKTSPKLTKLHLCQLVLPEMVKSLHKYLVNIRSVTNLGLHYKDVQTCVESVVNVLKSVKSIAHLEILYWYTADRDDAEKVVKAVASTLPPKSKVQVSCTKWDYSYLE